MHILLFNIFILVATTVVVVALISTGEPHTTSKISRNADLDSLVLRSPRPWSGDKGAVNVLYPRFAEHSTYEFQLFARPPVASEGETSELRRREDDDATNENIVTRSNRKSSQEGKTSGSALNTGSGLMSSSDSGQVFNVNIDFALGTNFWGSGSSSGSDRDSDSGKGSVKGLGSGRGSDSKSGSTSGSDVSRAVTAGSESRIATAGSSSRQQFSPSRPSSPERAPQTSNKIGKQERRVPELKLELKFLRKDLQAKHIVAKKGRGNVRDKHVAASDSVSQNGHDTESGDSLDKHLPDRASWIKSERERLSPLMTQRKQAKNGAHYAKHAERLKKKRERYPEGKEQASTKAKETSAQKRKRLGEQGPAKKEARRRRDEKAAHFKDYDRERFRGIHTLFNQRPRNGHGSDQDKLRTYSGLIVTAGSHIPGLKSSSSSRSSSRSSSLESIKSIKPVEAARKGERSASTETQASSSPRNGQKSQRSVSTQTPRTSRERRSHAKAVTKQQSRGKGNLNRQGLLAGKHIKKTRGPQQRRTNVLDKTGQRLSNAFRGCFGGACRGKVPSQKNQGIRDDSGGFSFPTLEGR